MMKFLGLIALVSAACPDGAAGMLDTITDVGAACEGLTAQELTAALTPVNTWIAAVEKHNGDPAKIGADPATATMIGAVAAAPDATFNCANVKCTMKHLDESCTDKNYFRTEANFAGFCATVDAAWKAGNAACADLNCAWTTTPTTTTTAATGESGNSAFALSAALALFAPLM